MGIAGQLRSTGLPTANNARKRTPKYLHDLTHLDHFETSVAQLFFSVNFFSEFSVITVQRFTSMVENVLHSRKCAISNNNYISTKKT